MILSIRIFIFLQTTTGDKPFVISLGASSHLAGGGTSSHYLVICSGTKNLCIARQYSIVKEPDEEHLLLRRHRHQKSVKAVKLLIIPRCIIPRGAWDLSTHRRPFEWLGCGFLSFQSFMVGLDGLEPSTSPLSGVRSSQLSYRPGEWLKA